jgi:hypothetical protein
MNIYHEENLPPITKRETKNYQNATNNKSLDL